MATKNRTEVSAAIQALVAVVGETEFKEQQDDNFAQNVVFRKDVADSDTALAATKTIDFLDIDYFEIAQNAATVAYTLNNIQQGEIKFLKITKTANQAVTFAVGTDISIRKSFITTQTIVIYRITNKDGSLYIESINIDNDTSGNILFKEIDIGDWNMDLNLSPVSQPAHGIGDKDKIILCQVMIFIDESEVSDINNILTDIDAAGNVGGFVNISDSNIVLTRLASPGRFDSTAYDDTSFNRGTVIIGYLL